MNEHSVETEPAAADAAPRKAPHTGRILVVDDERHIRDACRMVLMEQGYQVDIAEDGDKGLRMIDREHYDIVLLDLMMPTISGLEILPRIRADHPDTAVIVITGYATLDHAVAAMKKGAFDFIPKPFSPAQLRIVVEKVIKYTRALQDIAEARSRLRMMVNRFSDGVMATDCQKNAVLANPAFLHLIGYHGKSVIGRHIDTFIGCEPLRSMIDEALDMPLDQFAEISRELEPGQSGDHILRASCTPFRNRSGRNIGTITVLRDITAEKQMDQMKSDFVSLVSHEIRSPMNSLLMQIKVILDGLAGDVSDQQRDILTRVFGKIQNLINMASELLDLARIESGLISPDKENMDVADILTEQKVLHKDAARQAGIDIRFDPPSATLRVLANRQNMETVFSNLITNAIKYSPNGGCITLSAGIEEAYAAVRVSDTGIGISESNLKRIFSKFYRVKAAQTRMVHGTGLGLSIVERIVTAHHGTIRAESREGEGSTFTVYLPLSDP